MIMNMARRGDDDDDNYEGPQSFSAITPARCTELLSTQSVGRVAWQGPKGPQILPVTYVYYDGSIVFRTSPNSVLSDSWNRTSSSSPSCGPWTPSGAPKRSTSRKKPTVC